MSTLLGTVSNALFMFVAISMVWDGDLGRFKPPVLHEFRVENGGGVGVHCCRYFC